MTAKKSVESAKPTEEVNKSPLATKEFLIEEFGITEEDIKKYEVEKLFSFYGLTEEFFLEEKKEFTGSYDIISLLNLLQKNMNSEIEKEAYDFSYIVDAEEYKGEYPDLNTVVRIAVANGVADGGSSCVIDFEKNKGYYSFIINSVSRDIRYAEKIYDISAQEKEKIIEVLKEAKVEKWKHDYYKNDPSTSENALSFGLEFKDGTIITVNGHGGGGPKGYGKLNDVLFSIR